MSDVKKTFYGKWWIPSKPQNVIYGTLYIDELGVASFFTIQNFDTTDNLNIWPKIDALFGLVTSIDDNKDSSVKLFDLHKIKFSEGVLTKSNYSVSKALIGAPNAKENGFLFNTLMFFSQSWNWWIKVNGLSIKLNGVKKKKGIKSSYTQPDFIPLYRDDNFFIYIFFRGNYGVSVEHGFKILEQPFLNIDVKDSVDIKEAFKIKTDIERYFMVMWRARHLFNIFELRSSDGTQYEVVGKYDNQSYTNIDGRDTFSKYKRYSQKTIKKWFEINKEMNNLIDTFFFAFTSKDLDVYNKFLNYVFSLEQYHRIRVKDRRPLSAKDERMFNKVLKEVRGDSASWLKKILSNDREITFDIRLSELLSLHGSDENIRLTKITINKIKKTRHYLVHLDNKLKKDSLTPEELLDVNDSLILLFLGLLKKELKSK